MGPVQGAEAARLSRELKSALENGATLEFWTEQRCFQGDSGEDQGLSHIRKHASRPASTHLDQEGKWEYRTEDIFKGSSLKGKAK